MCRTLEVTISSKSRIYVGEKHTDINPLFSSGESVVKKFTFELEESIELFLSKKETDYVMEFCKMMAYRVIRGLGIDKTPRYQSMMGALRKQDATMADAIKKLVARMISAAKKPMAKLHKKMWKQRNRQRKLKKMGLTAVVVA